jgi:dihydrofolate reductase
MAKLIYFAITSLDGYINDESGNFEWAAPDEAEHAFANDLDRSIGTHLYGRRLYEVMRDWENPPADSSPVEQDYAEVWRAADKVVYSTTLDTVSTARTRIEPTFDTEAVQRMKASADRDLSIGGAGLAAHAIAAGLVDEYHQLVHPVVVGGGTPWLPDGVRVDLELLDQRRFDSGVVYLRYRVAA